VGKSSSLRNLVPAEELNRRPQQYAKLLAEAKARARC
jgi:hypothetical protein